MDNELQTEEFLKKPDNNLVWAILCTCFCCMPAGIYAIIKAAEVDSKWISGDREGAIKSAKEAKKWSIYGAVSIGIFFFLYLLIMIITVVGSSLSNL